MLEIVERCPAVAPCLPDADFLLADLCQRLEWGEGGQDSYLAARDAERTLVGADDDRLVLIAQVIPSMATVCSGRRLYCTDTGRIGIGHGSLSSQDQVWLLAGSKVPFIVRRHNGDYMTIVGETYEDGLMFGEQWPEDENELMDIALV